MWIWLRHSFILCETHWPSSSSPHCSSPSNCEEPLIRKRAEMRQGHSSLSLRHPSGEAGIRQGVWMATEPCQAACWPSGLGVAHFFLPPTTLPKWVLGIWSLGSLVTIVRGLACSPQLLPRGGHKEPSLAKTGQSQSRFP